MNDQGSRFRYVAAYFLLFVLALPIPVFNYAYMANAIEALRPAFKMPDGHYGFMLMPVDILMIRWLGELSVLGAVVFLGLALGSLSVRAIRRMDYVFMLAFGQCVFATTYGIYSAWIWSIHFP